jgi:ATP-binding protein involved in chromosome partitioning
VNIKHCYFVGAGKGGVGKSTVTLNLAITIASWGFHVGVLDADLYGPSLPMMMGLRNLPPPKTQEGKITPFTKFGIQALSMGFFLEEERSIVWRGPMLHKMLERMLGEIHWPPLDYLFIDLPPGTGDVPLSLSLLIPFAKSLVVTTPQELAFIDVIKAVDAFKQMGIPCCGLIENMVGSPFGSSRGQNFATRLSIPFLGTIFLDEKICLSGDQGIPHAVTDSHFAPLAKTLLAQTGFTQ